MRIAKHCLKNVTFIKPQEFSEEIQALETLLETKERIKVDYESRRFFKNPNKNNNSRRYLDDIKIDINPKVNTDRALETVGENLESQVVNESVDMGSLSQVGVADVEMKIKAKTTAVSVEFANKGK